MIEKRCALCGDPRTEEAHVKPAGSFKAGEDDRSLNIIPLCPTCHTNFDLGMIGISLDKKNFVLIDQEGKLRVESTKMSILGIRNEYVEWRDQICCIRIAAFVKVIRCH